MTMTNTTDKKNIQRIQQKLDALVQAESKKKNTPQILLAVQSKDVSGLDYQQSAGSDNIKKDSPFFIASITKMMTATVIFQLVDEGKISLDNPISKVLPPSLVEGIHVYKGKDYSSEIQIHQLLHQTSGIADFFQQKDTTTGKSVLDDIVKGNDVTYQREDYINMAKRSKPAFVPSANSGSKSFYSDTNYQLLGGVIENITGKSVAENFQTRIFDPLALSDSTYVFDKALSDKRKQPMVMHYKENEINIPNIMSSFAPDGGVVSTLEDMLKFLRAYFDSKLFDKKHRAVTSESNQWNTVFIPPLKYAYGLMRFKVPKWMTLYLFDSPELIGHSGSNASFAFYAPDKEVFIVGTFNQLDQESRPFHFMLQVLNCLE